MDLRKIVYQETSWIALGEVLLSGMMVGVFAALGYFAMNVLWGAAAGCLIMVVNYFFMAVTVSLAADQAEQGAVESAKKMAQLSSVVRLVVMGVALTLGIKLGANILALLLPIVFARPILLLAEFFRKKGDA